MKKPNLDTLVAAAQIFSSLAVLISIIFLITEYKRSGILNETYIENLVYGRVMELDRLIIENPDLAEIATKASIDPDSLTQTDRMRYIAYEHIFYDSWETLYEGYRDGLVNEETWLAWSAWFLREAKRKPMMGRKGNLGQLGQEFFSYLQEDLGLQFE